MQVIGIILTVVLVAVALFITINPLFSGKVPFTSGLKKEKLDKEALKEVVFTTLNEIELEYQMGKVTKEDYEVLKKKHEKQAAELMEIRETASNTEEIDDEMMRQVEKEIQEELAKRKEAKK